MTPEAVKLAWNTMAKNNGLAHVRILSATRLQKLRPRLMEAAQIASDEGISEEDVWTEVMDRIEASAFCRGEVKPYDGRRPWKADFDFMCQAKSFPLILEGKYNEEGDMDNFQRRRASRKQPQDRTTDEWRAVFTKENGELMKAGFLKDYWNHTQNGPAPADQGCLVPDIILGELGFEVQFTPMLVHCSTRPRSATKMKNE